MAKVAPRTQAQRAKVSRTKAYYYDNEKLEGEPYFLISNKTNWIQAQKLLNTYMMRDPIEHLIRDQKQELGFEDNQQRQETSVLKQYLTKVQ